MRTIGRTVLALLGVVLLATACSSKHTSFTASAAPSPVATSASLPAAVTSSPASPRPSSALSSPGSPTPPTTAPPTTAPPTTQGGSARLVLTDKDAIGDATRTVNVGTIIEVDLTVAPPSGVGAARSTNEAVVATISARGDESSASHAIFRAVAPGTANLYAMIFAACAPNVGCAAAMSYIFAISVVPAR
jgi:hypothetical protein